MPAHPVDAPKGYLTVADAAERAGVSVATVRRAIDRGEVRVRHEGWAIFVDARDVGKIKLKPRGRAGEDRVPVMLRPVLERYAAWEQAAGDKPVSVWLGELADKAAKWKG